jgi:hypothetical protein
MTLSRNFKQTLGQLLQTDADFRHALLQECVDCMLRGDPEELAVGLMTLRDFINGTIGFKALGEILGKTPKNLMRMVNVKANPTAYNLFHVLQALQELEGIRLETTVVARTRRGAAKPRKK